MKYDIEALKRKMLVKYPFFGSVLSNVEYKEEKGIPTAATDGEKIYFNPDFLGSLSVEEQIFVLAHEVCHIAFNHILRSAGKDPQLWNIATDGVINQFLKRDGLKIVKGGVDIEEAINYDAEKLYEKLIQDKKQEQEQKSLGEDQQGEKQQGNNQQQNSESGLSGGSGQKSEGSNQSGEEGQQEKGESESDDDSQEKNQDVGHDTHSMWKEAVKKHKEEKANDDIEKKKEEIEGMGERKAFDKNLEDKKEQLRELKEAISKAAAMAGSSTGRETLSVGDIGKTQAIVDWRYVLKRAARHDVDWSYRNASIEDGVVRPNLEEQPMAETQIVLDTSGSISEVLLKNFLRECKNILKNTKLRVGCFDTEFYGFHEIRTEKDIETIELQGGGGTDFDVAVEAFDRRAENKIIFTDGCADMPKKPIDAIWIVFGGRKINPPGGKVIYITPEQLKRLCPFEYDEAKGGKTR